MSVTETSTNITQTTETTFPSLRNHLRKRFQGRIEWVKLDYNQISGRLDVGVMALGGAPLAEFRDSLTKAVAEWLAIGIEYGMPVLAINGIVRLDELIPEGADVLSSAAVAELKTAIADIRDAIAASGVPCPRELFVTFGCRVGELFVMIMNPASDLAKIAPHSVAAINEWTERHAGWIAASEQFGFLFALPLGDMGSPEANVL